MDMKGTKRFRLAALLTALLMAAVVFVGCTQTPAPTATPAPVATSAPAVASATPAPTATPEPTPTAAPEPVTITFWHNYGADKETPYFADTIMKIFKEKFPWITVNVVAQGSDGYSQLITTSLGTGSTPDVARFDLTDVAGFAKQGALVPLDDMVGFSILKDQLLEGPMSSNLFQGKYYGLPLDTNCKAAVFNTTNLATLGLNAVPATMDELVAAAKDKSPGKPVISVSSAGDWDILPWFWLYGGVLSDEGFTKTTGYLDGADSVKAATDLKKLFDDKVLAIKELDGTADAWDGIKAKDYSMFMEGPWFFAFTADWKTLNIKPAPIPTVNGKTASIVGGESVVMFSNTKNKDASFEFMKFLLGEDVQVLMGVNMGQMPVLKSAAANAELTGNEVWSVYLKQLETAKTRIPTPQKSAVGDALKACFNSIFKGEAAPQAALSKCAATIDAELVK
jgi:multiple sugar transport system substrate-binding protein